MKHPAFHAALMACLAVVSFGACAAEPKLSAAEKLYQANCSACHGVKMQGAVGPSLGDHAWLHGAPNKANLIKIISKGVPEKDMPAWSPALNAAQIALLADLIAANAAKPAIALTPEAKAQQTVPDLNGFKLPKGFHISVYANQVGAARSMVVSDSGIVYVGSRNAGKVYALVPRADKQTA